MSSREETGFEIYEDRIWAVKNSPIPQMCKILSEGTDFHHWLLKMEIHPIVKILDNSTYIIRSTTYLFFSFTMKNG